jgi:diadenosine tetraphosphate (Ap4A) HIT family hydrolase
MVAHVVGDSFGIQRQPTKTGLKSFPSRDAHKKSLPIAPYSPLHEAFMEGFILVPDLAKKVVIVDWPISRILLQSSRDFPWILLVPRRPGVSQMHELTEGDQFQLMREISAASRLMITHFSCDRVNVAAMGNKVPQLHIHVVCRDREDPYWPETIWHQPYAPLAIEPLEVRRKQLFDIFHLQPW